MHSSSEEPRQGAKTVIFETSGDQKRDEDREAAAYRFARKHQNVNLICIVKSDYNGYRCNTQNLYVLRAKRPALRAAELVNQIENSVLVSMGNTIKVVQGLFIKGHREEGVEQSLFCIVPKRKGNNGETHYIFGDVGGSLSNHPCDVTFTALVAHVIAVCLSNVTGHVYLANIGEEQTKGDDLVKRWHQALEEVLGPDVYKGFMDPHLIGDPGIEADAYVAHGFMGNTGIKFMEYVFGLLSSEVKDNCAVSKWQFWKPILGQLFKKVFMGRLDKNRYNGAYLVGFGVPVIVGHGSASEKAVICALERAADVSTLKIYWMLENSDFVHEAMTKIRALRVRIDGEEEAKKEAQVEALRDRIIANLRPTAWDDSRLG